MLLIKEVAVSLNLTECRIKQFANSVLRKKDINLTPEQLLALDLLWNEGEMSQQQLADSMHKDKNSIVQLANALERKGLIKRLPNQVDKRSNILSLTPASVRIKDEVKKDGISLLNKMLYNISDKELKQFLITLNKIQDNISHFSS